MKTRDAIAIFGHAENQSEAGTDRRPKPRSVSATVTSKNEKKLKSSHHAPRDESPTNPLSRSESSDRTIRPTPARKLAKTRAIKKHTKSKKLFVHSCRNSSCVSHCASVSGALSGSSRSDDELAPPTYLAAISWNFDVHVDAVHQRPGDSSHVLFDLRRCAVAASSGIAAITAGTGVAWLPALAVGLAGRVRKGWVNRRREVHRASGARLGRCCYRCGSNAESRSDQAAR